MRLGIFAKTFPGRTPDGVLGRVRAAGYVCTQFNLSCAGLDPMPDNVPEDAVAAIAAAAARHEVALVALSGTYNMCHPDPSVRIDGLRRLGAVIGAAKCLSIPVVTLCTGTRDPHDLWRDHPANGETEAWTDMRQAIGSALDLAEAAGIDLGIEPEHANVVRSVTDARRLIEDMGSDRLKIVLDPANLFERATPDEARRIVGAAVDEAAGQIVMVHAKDRHADGRFATVGNGIVDFPFLIRRLGASGFDGPLVTHGLRAEEAATVAAFLGPLSDT